MAKPKVVKPRRRFSASGYIDVKYMRKMFERMRYNDSADVALEEVRDQVYAALILLGHAKGTAGGLRDIVDNLDDADDDLQELAMYLEDDIDEIENGDLYDLFKKLDGITGGEDY